MILAIKKKKRLPSYNFINENKFQPVKYIFTVIETHHQDSLIPPQTQTVFLVAVRPILEIFSFSFFQISRNR